MVGKEKLDRRITIRLSAVEEEVLLKDANLAQITISELIRRRYYGREILASTDAQTIRELRRMGGLLKHIWSESSIDLSKEIRPVLDTIRNSIERLANNGKPDG